MKFLVIFLIVIGSVLEASQMIKPNRNSLGISLGTIFNNGEDGTALESDFGFLFGGYYSYHPLEEFKIKFEYDYQRGLGDKYKDLLELRRHSIRHKCSITPQYYLDLPTGDYVNFIGLNLGFSNFETKNRDLEDETNSYLIGLNFDSKYNYMNRFAIYSLNINYYIPFDETVKYTGPQPTCPDHFIVADYDIKEGFGIELKATFGLDF